MIRTELFIAVTALAGIGTAVAGVMLAFALQEVWRAWRQSGRLAAVYLRLGFHPMTFRIRLRIFRLEIGQAYDAVTIGPYRLPYDPSRPIGRAWSARRDELRAFAAGYYGAVAEAARPRSK